jgi:hypothetical protein
MGHPKIVRYLIVEGHASVDGACEKGYAPLFAAIELCSRKLECLADSELKLLPSDVFKRDMDMLRWLVEDCNANVNTVTVSGKTPLLYALSLYAVVNIDVVRFLLSVGARVNDLDNPVFNNSYAKASIQEEVQKLEVPALSLHHFLSLYS